MLAASAVDIVYKINVYLFTHCSALRVESSNELYINISLYHSESPIDFRKKF